MHLFSGSPSKPDGFANYFRSLGGECFEIDLLAGSEFDLIDDAVWGSLLTKVTSDLAAGKFHALLMGVPCDTFSRARRGANGPSVLRGAVGADRYGLSTLSPTDKERTRKGTCLAVRGALIIEEFAKLGLLVFAEHPRKLDGLISMFDLDEYTVLLSTSSLGLRLQSFVQCAFGSRTTKPSTGLTNICLAMPEECTHARVAWRYLSNGRTWRYLSTLARTRVVSVSFVVH